MSEFGSPGQIRVPRSTRFEPAAAAETRGVGTALKTRGEQSHSGRAPEYSQSHKLLYKELIAAVISVIQKYHCLLKEKRNVRP